MLLIVFLLIVILALLIYTIVLLNMNKCSAEKYSTDPTTCKNEYYTYGIAVVKDKPMYFSNPGKENPFTVFKQQNPNIKEVDIQECFTAATSVQVQNYGKLVGNIVVSDRAASWLDTMEIVIAGGKAPTQAFPKAIYNLGNEFWKYIICLQKDGMDDSKLQHVLLASINLY